MFLRKLKKQLPVGFVDGVALKTHLPNIQLSTFRGVFRKLSKKVYKNSRSFRIFLGILAILYFTSYQPVLSMPPIKRSLVLAAEAKQEEKIESYHLSSPFQLPHPGYLTSFFSSWHPGIDIAIGLGMPIRPVTSGKVVEVNYGVWGLGHNVVVEHEQGFRSSYGHMGKIYVKVGAIVDNNSSLGEVGLTGKTSGPHTHLEITKDGKYIDPLIVLPKLPDWPKEAGQAPKGDNEIVKKEAPARPSNTGLLKLEGIGYQGKNTNPDVLKGLNNLPL